MGSERSASLVLMVDDDMRRLVARAPTREGFVARGRATGGRRPAALRDGKAAIEDRAGGRAVVAGDLRVPLAQGCLFGRPAPVAA